jgi:hypothetical protein
VYAKNQGKIYFVLSFERWSIYISKQWN